MSTYIQPLVDAVRAKTLATWPDAAAGGVWEVEHIADVPWGDLKDKTPFAVIQITSVTRVPRGLANRHFQIGVTVHRMQRVAGPNGRLFPLMEALRDAFTNAKLTCGPVLPTPLEIMLGDQLTANQILASKELFYLRAAALSFSVLVGDNQ